jgi:FixJ family two-component response regulator
VSGGPPAPPRPPVIHLVEDDASTREATARFFRASGYQVRAYGSAEELLATPLPDAPGCLVVDLQLPGANGLDLQQAVARRDNPLPVVFLTGHGEVPDSVQAMKSGAVDFLAKTSDGEALIDAVRAALARDAEDRALRDRQRLLRARYERLTPREREVFAHVISGQLNKQVGYDLGITERTIKIHRHQVLAKMEADSLADLVRMASELQIAPRGQVS